MFADHRREPSALLIDSGQGRGRTAVLPIRSRTRWSAPDTTQQCPLAARLPNGTSYRCRTFDTMYRRNVGVKWGVDLEDVATRFLRPEAVWDLRQPTCRCADLLRNPEESRLRPRWLLLTSSLTNQHAAYSMAFQFVGRNTLLRSAIRSSVPIACRVLAGRPVAMILSDHGQSWANTTRIAPSAAIIFSRVSRGSGGRTHPRRAVHTRTSEMPMHAFGSYTWASGSAHDFPPDGVEQLSEAIQRIGIQLSVGVRGLACLRPQRSRALL